MSNPTPEVLVVPEAMVVAEEIKEAKPEYIEITAQPVLLLRNSVRIELGNGMHKEVSYSDFISILSSSTESIVSKTNQEFQLPEGTFHFGLSNDKMTIMCYHKESKQQFSYYSRDNRRTDTFEIMTPNIIISYFLQKDKDRDWVFSTEPRYFATNLPINKLPKGVISSPNRSIGLGLIPFTNAYDDAKMCYGENRMPARFEGGNLRGLSYYYTFLWTTPFNDDLGINSKVGEGMYIADWYKHLKETAEKNLPFPYHKLRDFPAAAPA